MISLLKSIGLAFLILFLGFCLFLFGVGIIYVIADIVINCFGKGDK